VCLYRIPLVLPESRIAQAGFIDLGSDSLPCVAREFPIKAGADGTLANSVSEPSLYLAEVQTSWACGRVAPEVPGTGARQIVFVFGAYYVAHFVGYGGKICLWPRRKLVVLAGSFAVRRSHQSLRIAGAPVHLLGMTLG
jgi:hypothetical protein